MSDFRKVAVGDTVFSLQSGEGVVSKIDTPNATFTAVFEKHPFGQAMYTTYEVDGKFAFYPSVTPDLYWSKPEIIAPKRKVKVKRSQEIWVNVYDSHLRSHPSKKIADAMQGDNRVACVPVTVKWEEEVDG